MKEVIEGIEMKKRLRSQTHRGGELLVLWFVGKFGVRWVFTLKIAQRGRKHLVLAASNRKSNWDCLDSVKRTGKIKKLMPHFKL